MWASVAEYVWEGQSTGSRMARTILHPAAMVFGAVVATRNRRYDAHVVPASGRIPAMSIGNLTVGGTGKTPIAAWCVAQLRRRGASPAIVMRGVGDDEWRVHGMLNPGTRVIVSPDRLAGMMVAQSQGADCAVLDDAFQHRRAPRVVDVVLLSADRWAGTARLLPAGPFREPLSALRRATLIVVTVKAASSAAVDEIVDVVSGVAPHVPIAVARLVPDTLRLATAIGRRDSTTSPGHHSGARPRGDLLTHPATWLSGQTVHVLSAIGDPASFEAQLQQVGAILAGCHRFRDHHTFTDREVERVAAAASGTDGVICTLKDAVKLAARWPRAAPPLWYLSQSVVLDRGADAFDRACDQVIAARQFIVPPAARLANP